MTGRICRSILLGLLVCRTVLAVEGGTVAEGYEVATWRGFRTAAISYTFDDGTPKQFEVALPIFNEAGLKVTLFTVTEAQWAFPGWDKLQAAANAGHEIASHSATHPDLSTLSDAGQEIELNGSRIAIEENIDGPAGITLAYPFCVPGKESIVAENYFAARICSGQVVPATPPDFLRIDSVSCGDLSSVKQLQDFQATASSAAQSGGWMVYLLHGVDDDGGYSPIASSVLQESVDFFVANDDAYWVETFGNVVRYIEERDAVSVSETSISESRIELDVSDTLDDSVYNYPISLRRELPEGWAAARVTQGAQLVSSRLANDGEVKWIEFDVVPDAGGVVIEVLDTRAELTIERGSGEGKFILRLEGASGVAYTLFSGSDLVGWNPYQEQSVLSPADIGVGLEGGSIFFRAGVAEEAGGSIGAANPLIKYSGRSEGIGTASVTLGYSGARARLRFRGDSVGMWMADDSGENYVNVFIDGAFLKKIRLDAGDDYYELADGLEAGEHTVEVARATEGSIGLSRFAGFELGGSGARALEWGGGVERKIEFIGDSITCGYGVEVDDPNLHFEPATENFSFGYSGLVARDLEVDYLVVSRSGIGMARNYDGPFEGSEATMPDVYPNTFYQQSEGGVWDSSQYAPDVVCVNLGTNDFSTTGVNVETFKAAYVEFGEMLLERYPSAKLLVLQGPMENGAGLQAALESVVGTLSAGAVGRVHFFKLSGQGSVGFGADWHPNQAQSRINADELVEYLSGLMGW